MAKIVLFAVIIAVLLLQQGEALNCFQCFEACEVSKAATITCGKITGSMHEAVCIAETPKDSKTPKLAIRKCQIVNKGKDYECPPGSICKTCRSDYCNAGLSLGSNSAMVGVFAALFVTKFLLN